MGEQSVKKDMYEKIKKECLTDIQDEKEKELFFKKFLFALVRT